jgi:tryptophan halogenase
MADRAADWLAAHYAAPAPTAQFPDLTLSPELFRTLDQFTRRGRLPFFEDAPMLVQEFGALLQAVGVPSGQGPLAAADSTSEESAARAFEARANAAFHAAPLYGEWLTRSFAG